MYVCVHVRVYVCVCVHVRVYVCVCVHVRVYVCVLSGAYYYGDAYPQHRDVPGDVNPDYNLTCCSEVTPPPPQPLNPHLTSPGQTPRG